MFKSKIASLEERVASSTHAVNQKTTATIKARDDLSAALTDHCELGDEIGRHIVTTQRAAETRVAHLRELQQNAYLHADDTSSSCL